MRTDRYKLCVAALDLTELYDLKLDPHETTNLAEDPEYDEVRATLMNRLVARMLCMGQAPEHMMNWGSEVVSR